MAVKQINSMTEVSAISWNALIQNKDPFLRHEFLLALEQSGAVSEQTGWLPHHLLLEEDNQLIAAMPLYLKYHSRGEYVFDQQWADAYAQSAMAYYPKWLNAIPFTPCQGQRILINKNRNAADIIPLCVEFIQQHAEVNNISSLHCLFADKAQTEILQHQLLIRQNVQFQWFNNQYADFDDYLQTFTSRKRKQTKKERQQVKNAGIQMVQVQGEDICEQQWQVFFQFYQLTYLKRGRSAYLNIDFFKQLAKTMAEQILLILAVKDQRYVGAALSFIGKNTLYGRYWGCYQEYKHLHFEACYYQGLDYCIKHKLQIFDSGAQGEHKIARGFIPITTYSAHWVQNSQFSKLIANFLDREKVLIQQYKQQCYQYLPFNQQHSVQQKK
ncbi:MAG: N-acetyltransferase [Methylococcales symbiont of Hymedesmia sp. n. MRB-2018]|nr:MAG: N-acetyltransferase [Methylococcales symbiont of Hymedesmia sp. n. MRB-2018]